MIADTIVRNVIDSKKSNIKCWGLHRRWPPDDIGHEFTAQLYISKETSDEIDNLVMNNRMFRLIRDELEYTVECNKSTEFSVITDKYWPISIQESWPWFIQGICETLLRMITCTKKNTLQTYSMQELPREKSNLEDLYKEIENEINKIWTKEGYWPFLHHLNAIFGYTPIQVDTEQYVGPIIFCKSQSNSSI